MYLIFGNYFHHIKNNVFRIIIKKKKYEENSKPL